MSACHASSRSASSQWSTVPPPSTSVRAKMMACCVSSVTDPTVLDATRARTNRDEVYRAAAAERALLDQSRVSAAIRQLGAEIVTGAPEDLPPALADRYIALKAAGRL